MERRYAFTRAALACGALALALVARATPTVDARAAPTVPLVEAPTGLQGCATRCGQIERVYASVLAAVRAQGGRAAALPWHLIVVRLPDEQALALPEGQIVLSEAFVVERQMSDEMLAFVLAHEMAHAVLEHERQTLTYARALLPRQVPRTVQDMYTETAFNVGFLRLLEPICHQVELEADELGLMFAAAAGYRPLQALDFMLAEADADDVRPTLFSTHPAAALRLQRLRTRLPLAWRVWQATGARTAD